MEHQWTSIPPNYWGYNGPLRGAGRVVTYPEKGNWLWWARSDQRVCALRTGPAETLDEGMREVIAFLEAHQREISREELETFLDETLTQWYQFRNLFDLEIDSRLYLFPEVSPELEAVRETIYNLEERLESLQRQLGHSPLEMSQKKDG